MTLDEFLTRVKYLAEAIDAVDEDVCNDCQLASFPKEEVSVPPFESRAACGLAAGGDRCLHHLVGDGGQLMQCCL